MFLFLLIGYLLFMNVKVLQMKEFYTEKNFCTLLKVLLLYKGKVVPVLN
jgi:hypothetical protein